MNKELHEIKIIQYLLSAACVWLLLGSVCAKGLQPQ